MAMMDLNQEAIDALTRILRDFGYHNLRTNETSTERVVYGSGPTMVKRRLVIEAERWEESVNGN